jgi:membrane-associated phospholipid phosphatase
LCATRLARAQATGARSLRETPALDVAVTVGGATAWVVSEIFKDDLAPSRCRWCATNTLDDGARRALVWRSTATADAMSNVAGFVLVPVAAIGIDALAAAHDGALGNAPEDALLVTEASVIAADVDQLAKMLFGRERPFVHALPEENKRLTAQPSDNNLSFFSGHTTEAFALAAASGTIGALRGYRWAPVSCVVSGTFAATTAYLRIAADKHWLSDVVVGIVIGAGIGFAVPYVFHPAIVEPPAGSAVGAPNARAVPIVPTLTLGW